MHREKIPDDFESYNNQMALHFDSKQRKKGCCGGKKETQNFFSTGVDGNFIKLNKYYWVFYEDGYLIYKTEPDYLYAFTTKKRFVMDQSEANIRKAPMIQTRLEEFRQKAEDIYLDFEVQKFNINIFSPFVIVNQTDLNIDFGEKSSKSKMTTLMSN